MVTHKSNQPFHIHHPFFFQNPKRLGFCLIAKTDELSIYPKEEIAYTLLKLVEGGFIIAKPTYAGGKIFNFYISDLTFSGHQHLEKIRNINRWNKIKSVGSKIGDFSLEAIEKIAEGVTSAAISKYFGST